eukprot:7268298-Pyramimonas_sp.AAC.1
MTFVLGPCRRRRGGHLLPPLTFGYIASLRSLSATSSPSAHFWLHRRFARRLAGVLAGADVHADVHGVAHARGDG